MKTLLILSIVFASCSNRNSSEVQHAAKDTTLQTSPVKVDSTKTITVDTNCLKFIVWYIDFYKKKKIKNQHLQSGWLNADSLISGLNASHPQIKLDKVKSSGDTLYTKIDDSEYLGERIGSDGANAYIADVVINLTSLKNIRYVKIDFEDGSHISHGTWSAADFKMYKEEK